VQDRTVQWRAPREGAGPTRYALTVALFVALTGAATVGLLTTDRSDLPRVVIAAVAVGSYFSGLWLCSLGRRALFAGNEERLPAWTWAAIGALPVALIGLVPVGVAGTALLSGLCGFVMGGAVFQRRRTATK
jgi:hypothetical protein